MGLALLVAVILVPIAEIWAAVQVAHQIGVLPTILLLLIMSAFGPRLVRREGLGVWRRAQARLNEGQVPGRELSDGVLLLFAGILLTVPGFLTGIVGALPLLPPVRSVVRAGSGAWFARRVRRNVNVRVYSGGRWHEAGSHDPGERTTTHDGDSELPRAPRAIEPPSDK
jgi:UPF0716 protein FxsA